MSDPRTRSLGPWLRRFLAEYIVTERNLARNTQVSYRDTFTLLIPLVSARVRKPADRLAVDDLSSRRVLEFLAHLEDERGCSVQTRNQRLSAIRAFARFVASRDPGHLEWSASIRAIAVKKAAPQPIGWLTKTEMKALLDVPDRRTPRGRVEHALLLFLFNTGARVSEATALVVRDLELGGCGDRHALVTLHGKGGKRRQCPLWPRTADVLAELVNGRSTASDAVFLSRYQRPYTRFGVYRLVERLCRSRARARRETDHAPFDSAFERLQPASVRGRHQYDPGLARTCQPRDHQHLRRDRSRDEGQGNGAVRCRRARTGSPVEGGQGADGLPQRALSGKDYVAEGRRIPNPGSGFRLFAIPSSAMASHASRRCRVHCRPASLWRREHPRPVSSREGAGAKPTGAADRERPEVGGLPHGRRPGHQIRAVSRILCCGDSHDAAAQPDFFKLPQHKTDRNIQAARGQHNERRSAWRSTPESRRPASSWLLPRIR